MTSLEQRIRKAIDHANGLNMKDYAAGLMTALVYVTEEEAKRPPLGLRRPSKPTYADASIPKEG